MVPSIRVLLHKARRLCLFGKKEIQMRVLSLFREGPSNTFGCSDRESAMRSGYDRFLCFSGLRK